MLLAILKFAEESTKSESESESESESGSEKGRLGGVDEDDGEVGVSKRSTLASNDCSKPF